MRSTGPNHEIGAGALPDRLQVLFTAALELTGPHDLDAALQRIVDGAAAVADARYAALGLFGDDGRIATFVHHGLDELTVRRIGLPPEGRGLLGTVIVTDRPIRLDDLTADPRAAGFPQGHPQMRTFLGVPIIRGGRRYGNLYLTEKHGGRPFDDDDEALVAALAAFAAGAIESAELVAAERERAHAIGQRVAAEEQARARRELLAKTIAAQEAERARVARDLHDDVGQALTSVLLGLRLVEDSLKSSTIDVADARARTADLRELVADALRRARRLAFDLRPTVLDDMGLAPALARLGADVAERSGLQVDLAVGLHTDERLAPDTETVVYRVVQEALTNVARHAGASSVSVSISVVDHRVRTFIEDDGIGFDTSLGTDREHLGLSGMEERARLVGGRLDVSSALGCGTTVLLEVPRA